jgi:ankyrin repeat protein
MISTTNDCNQTLAHISIFCDYPTLLSRLVDWRINLAITDVNGLTALHCAYMKGDSESVRNLRRGGASETATDTPGRAPSGLQPEGSESDTDFDAEVAAG